MQNNTNITNGNVLENEMLQCAKRHLSFKKDIRRKAGNERRG